ncbi:MAG: hypothetical protein ACJA2X_000869 [Halocynthiibacter sp.]|jgi:hypothetical protein
MILDPTLGHHASRVPPEHRLIASVISRAVLDLFSKVSLVANDEEADTTKAESLQFLTATGGSWAQRRRELCLVVDVCPDKLRRRVIAILEGEDVALTDERHAFSDIERARALWYDQARRAADAQTARVAQAHVRSVRRRALADIEAEQAAQKDTNASKRDAIHDALGHGVIADVVVTLINGPLTIREIGFAIDGAADSETIRARLLRARDKGVVRKDGPEWHLDLNQYAEAA